MADGDDAPTSARSTGPEKGSGRPGRLARLLRWRPRFSLRSLLLLVMLAGCGTALWLHRCPWRVAFIMEHDVPIGFSLDERYVIAYRKGETGMKTRWSLETGASDGEFKGENFYGATMWSKSGRQIDFDDGSASVVNVEAGAETPLTGAEMDWAGLSESGRWAVVWRSNAPSEIWRLYRPEKRWGILLMQEFWLTVAFAGVFVWSVWRDRKALRKREAEG